MVILPSNDNKAASTISTIKSNIPAHASNASACRSTSRKKTTISNGTAILCATHGSCSSHSSLCLYRSLPRRSPKVYISPNTITSWRSTIDR